MKLFLSPTLQSLGTPPVDSASRSQSALSLRGLIGCSPRSQLPDILRTQAVVHIAACALFCSEGWLYAVLMLTDQTALSRAFLPSMPEDELQQVLRGLDRSDAGARRCSTSTFAVTLRL